MGQSIIDIFKAETEIEIKAGELFALMKEASKAEFLMNAVKCEVPYRYIREMSTGESEQPLPLNTLRKGENEQPDDDEVEIADFYASKIKKGTPLEAVLPEFNETPNETKIPEREEDLCISKEEFDRYHDLSKMDYNEIKEIADSLGIKNIDLYGKTATIAKIIIAERSMKKGEDHK